MGDCSFWQGNYPVAVDYSKKALVISEELVAKSRNGKAVYGKPEWGGDISSLSMGIMSTLGNSYRRMSDHLRAIETFKRQLGLLEAEGNKKDIASMLNNIAGIYRSEGDDSMAKRYYAQALKIAEEIDYKYVIVANLANVGEIYKEGGDYKMALENLTRALKMNAEEVDITGINDRTYRTGYITREIGAVYLGMKDYAMANTYFDKATKVLEPIGAKDQLTNILLDKSKLYFAQDNFKQAIRMGEKGLEMAEEAAMTEFQRDFSLDLYKAHKALNQNRSALEYHERFTALNDSLKLGETGKKLQQMEFSKQMLADSLVQEEEKLKVEMAFTSQINKKDKTRNILLWSGFLVLLMAVGLWSRLKFTRKSRAVLQIEKDRSENLLLNILPAEVAEELKQNGKAKARDYEMVSIIFTDFHGFTEMSSKMNADQLVSELNHCFKGFDAIMDKHSIEKIKTIGDAYMAAGGLMVTHKDSAKNTVLAALEMQKFISNRKVEMDTLHKHAFQMRAGIHTGAVVAGIVGVKKFQYDIWGDTVNTASRMESNGVIGKVNISETTYELIKEDLEFIFEKRGEITVKGKGAMEMYYVAMAS